MENLKGTKTEKNLQASFAGESQARNKYTYFAKVARKEGYHYIAQIFEETAINEMQHAKDEFKLLNGIGDTAANLKEAIAGEHYETTEMYVNFEKDAKDEGFADVARLFKQIAKVEAEHRDRYKKLLQMPIQIFNKGILDYWNIVIFISTPSLQFSKTTKIHCSFSDELN